jgi:hypothetical protein
VGLSIFLWNKYIIDFYLLLIIIVTYAFVQGAFPKWVKPERSLEQLETFISAIPLLTLLIYSFLDWEWDILRTILLAIIVYDMTINNNLLKMTEKESIE